MKLYRLEIEFKADDRLASSVASLELMDFLEEKEYAVLAISLSEQYQKPTWIPFAARRNSDPFNAIQASFEDS